MNAKRQTLHPAIRSSLGIAEDLSDEDAWSFWAARSTRVCKPCWELKYCPYGPFVDQSPLLPPTRDGAVAHNEYLREILKSGVIGERRPLDDETRQSYHQWIQRLEDAPLMFADFFANELRVNQMVRECADEGIEDPIKRLLTIPKPPIEWGQTAFPIEDKDEALDRLKSEFTPEVQEAIKRRVGAMKQALLTGFVDERRPLDDVRRKHMEAMVEQFDEKDYPETIPEEVLQTACNVFGHVCPVVFVAESVTETSEPRRRGRYIPFNTKMRVVRRDNYTCQGCGRHLLDTDVEFDHVIPVSRGGSSEEHNIRLTCFDCNRSKSDQVVV